MICFRVSAFLKAAICVRKTMEVWYLFYWYNSTLVLVIYCFWLWCIYIFYSLCTLYVCCYYNSLFWFVSFMGTNARINILWWWDPSPQKKHKKMYFCLLNFPQIVKKTTGMLLFCFMKNVKGAWVFVCKLKDRVTISDSQVYIYSSDSLATSILISSFFLEPTFFHTIYIFLKITHGPPVVYLW